MEDIRSGSRARGAVLFVEGDGLFDELAEGEGIEIGALVDLPDSTTAHALKRHGGIELITPIENDLDTVGQYLHTDNRSTTDLKGRDPELDAIGGLRGRLTNEVDDLLGADGLPTTDASKVLCYCLAGHGSIQGQRAEKIKEHTAVARQRAFGASPTIERSAL